MTARTAIIERAAGNLAVSKLVPVGRYLDLVDAGELCLDPLRYQAMAVGALDMLKQYRTNPTVRAACGNSQALADMLENIDFAVGVGALALQPLTAPKVG